MNVRRDYWYDARRGVLWILPLKCASRTLAKATGRDGLLDHAEAVARQADADEVVAAVRHPWDRLVSARWSVLIDGEASDDRPMDEWAQREILGRSGPLEMDPHVRPYSATLEGINVDTFLRVDRLTEDWDALRARYPDLMDLTGLRLNPTFDRPRHWTDVPFDWSTLEPVYADDFALVPGWQVAPSEPPPPWEPTTQRRRVPILEGTSVALEPTEGALRFSVERKGLPELRGTTKEERRVLSVAVDLSQDGGQRWAPFLGFTTTGEDIWDRRGRLLETTTVARLLPPQAGAFKRRVRMRWRFNRAGFVPRCYLDLV